ncbi:FAD:protein FMN transferase [Gordonia sp. HNM0687]|uniref:FAD:protein FMN transferase n=1 Tax=Gordonia mangrovi TaxID=2665643 RepID=A0A6L7GQC8_9ACTN|nr:FAD:protein FMN transferase [Gordonia mangrovi]MXP22159.1 FAD:protein FMN transferase [Gordonia mangrovi]UVF77932.1 FAD:protein FMN transferase [Gordonia mangrovi]
MTTISPNAVSARHHDAAPTTRAWVEHIMGMPISVHVRADDPRRTDVEAAVATAFADLRRADDLFSTWNPNSALMLARAGTETAVCDPWRDEVADWCVSAAETTDGLFTTDLIGPDGSRGWDPTGLVKGWAVTVAARHLRHVPGASFSINAGGDILCGRGPRTPAQPWRIGIQDPADPHTVAATVEVVDGAVATSGASARGAHIVDPRDGGTVDHPGSVTVTGPDLVWCDIWATVSFIDPEALTRHPHGQVYRRLILG